MANNDNLIPFDKRTESEQREIAKKGGKKSGESRRTKKAIQEILNDYLSTAVNKNETLKDIAEEVGISGKQSIKELVTAVCVLNTLKSGDLSDLQRLTSLLGEEPQHDDGNADVEDTLAVIRECAYADRDKQ